MDEKNKKSFSAQSSLSIFVQKDLRKCKDTYFVVQNKYLHIYKDSFGAKIFRDDWALTINCNDKMHMESERMTNIFSFL